MKNTKVRKLITRTVALLLVGTMAVTDLSVETMASTVPETQDLYIQTLGADNSASILDKGFDRSQMKRRRNLTRFWNCLSSRISKWQRKMAGPKKSTWRTWRRC